MADRKRLTIGPIGPSIEDVVAARKAIWAGWIDECECIHAEWIDMMLDELVPKER